MKRRSLVVVVVAAACCILAATQAAPAAAQGAVDWPTRPVRIVTPFPVGGGPETVLRMVAERLSKLWGKPVVVENRPGGSSFIAISAFKQGDTDGHDLIQLDNPHLTAYPFLFAKLPYDPQADFEHLAPLFKASFFFAVAAGSPYRIVGDLIADAKAHPGKLNYGSWSVGNPVHLGSAYFQALPGTTFEHVVYKETSQLYQSLGNGDLAFALGSYGTSGAVQRAGKIRYLAVAGPRRLLAYPDVPTVGESGGPPQFEVVGWTTLSAPKSIRPEVAEKIRADLRTVLADPQIAQRYSTFGYEPFPATKTEFDAQVAAESARYRQTIRASNIRIE